MQRRRGAERNKALLRNTEARRVQLLRELELRPGYQRRGPDGQGRYRFRRGARAVLAKPTDKSFARGSLRLYLVPDTGVGIFAELQQDGTYAVSKRLTPEALRARYEPLLYVAPRRNFQAALRNQATPITVNGGVPLYTLLNTTKIEVPADPNGDPEQTKRVNAYAYTQFNSEGRLITDPRFPRALNRESQLRNLVNVPAPLCENQALDLAKPDSCFVRGMTERLKGVLGRLEQNKAQGKDGCAVNYYRLQPHQRSVFEVARMLADPRKAGQLNGTRGLLAFHNTGSGKTITSLGIVLAFWDSPRNIVIATTPANEADNNLSKYAENMFLVFPEYVPRVFKAGGYPPGPWPNKGDTYQAVKKWCNNKDNIKPLLNRVRTYTFTTLASELGKKGTGFGRANPMGDKLFLGGAGQGSVLIMDEVQSLFTPDPKYKEATDYLVPKLTDAKLVPKMFVFALTATPGNTVKDMLDVLNFVRPAAMPPLTEADARNAPEKVAGLVSYVDIRSDTTRYGTKKVSNVYVSMSPRYYAGFLKTVSLDDEALNYSKVPVGKEMGFLIKQRTAGNFLNKTALSGLFSEAELRDFQQSRPVPRAVTLGGNQVRILSDKLMGVLENATSMPGKQYVWVAELNTAKVAMRALERMGWAQVKPQDYAKTRDPKTGKTVLKARPELERPGKRFILYKKGTADGEQLDEGTLKAFADTFSDRGNDDGGRVKIMLATETYYQGLDMRALQGVHLVDSLFNATADRQAVGRALRLCGHSGAPSRNVTVYRYFSVPPGSFDPEQVAQGAKGAAAKKLAGLGQADKKLRSIPGAEPFKGVVSLPDGQNARAKVPPGINTYVYADAARRQQEVDTFQLALKAFAVDCPLFKNVYHATEPFQCGVRPSAAAAATAAARQQGGGKKPKKTQTTPAAAAAKPSAPKRSAWNRVRAIFGLAKKPAKAQAATKPPTPVATKPPTPTPRPTPSPSPRPGPGRSENSARPPTRPSSSPPRRTPTPNSNGPPSRPTRLDTPARPTRPPGRQARPPATQPSKANAAEREARRLREQMEKNREQRRKMLQEQEEWQRRYAGGGRGAGRGAGRGGGRGGGRGAGRGGGRGGSRR
jgi:hypothetical protein